MKVAIIGSRTFNDIKMLEEKVHIIIHEENEGSFKDVIIVSGGAKGADALGKVYAQKHKLGYKEYKPNWKDLSHPDARIKHGAYGAYDANAGHRRNTLIIEDANIVVAFHNGSPGTADSLRKAKALGKKIYEYRF